MSMVDSSLRPVDNAQMDNDGLQNMPPVITASVTTNPTFVQLFVANFVLLRYRVPTLVVFAAFTLGGLYMVIGSFFVGLSLGSLLCIIGGLFILSYFPIFTAIGVWRHRHSKLANGPVTYSFDSAGMHTRSATLNQTIQWPGILRIRRSRRFLFVFLSAWPIKVYCIHLKTISDPLFLKRCIRLPKGVRTLGRTSENPTITSVPIAASVFPNRPWRRDIACHRRPAATYPTAAVPRFRQWWRRPIRFERTTRLLPLMKQYDIVTCYRMNRRENLRRRLYAWLWTWLICTLFELEIRDMNCAFKLYKRRIFDVIQMRSKGTLLNSEILAQARRKGFTITQVGVHHYPRLSGKAGPKTKVIFEAFWELGRWYRAIRSE